MNKQMLSMLAVLAVTASATAGAGAAPHELLPDRAGDLSAAATIAPGAAANAVNSADGQALAAPNPSRDTVSLSWAAGGAAPSAEALTPFVARSKETYVTVTADQLAAGVPLHTTAPRALVRVQALGEVGPREQLAIHPLSMTVLDQSGHAYEAGAGMEMIVSADKLAKADVPFAAGTSAFRFHPSLGAGSFKLKVDGAYGGDRYLINVVEPDSPYTLTMQTGAQHYLHGQQLSLTAALQDASVGTAAGSATSRRALGKIDAYVISPAGRRFPVSFKPAADGSMRASLMLDADEAPAPGLWEARVEASAAVQGQTVLRSARLAFPVALPAARLTRGVTLTEGAGVNLLVGVEAAAAGRYEVRGMLYGTVKGALVPLGVADSAQWMEAGQGGIALSFAPELISGASGPFELRDLFLLDQGRMGVLHRQQRALVVSEDEVVRAGGRGAGTARIAPAEVHVKRAPQLQ
jgi:hypothetical protein